MSADAREAAPVVEPRQDVAAHQAAVEAALAALRVEVNARLAAIPSRLAAELAKAERGDPTKRAQRQADAIRWADEAQTMLLQALADREAEMLTRVRAMELASLEALRGGCVLMEERDIETLILKDGAPVWRRGRKTTKRERVNRPRITNRDGLDSLARQPVDANGNPTRPPAIDPILYAAGMRYRRLYEDADPEKGLKAVDPSSAGGGRAPGDPWASATVAAIQAHAEAGRAIARIERNVREDVEASHGIKAGARAVVLLREIAGKGTTVHAMVGSGGPATRAIALLETALAALAARFGLL